MESSAQQLVQTAKELLDSEVEPGFATASEPGLEQTQRKSSKKTESSSSSSTDGSASGAGGLLADLRKSWLGSGIPGESTKNEPSRERSKDKKRFSLIEGHHREKAKSSSEVDMEAVMKMASQSKDPLQELLALQIVQSMQEKRKRGRGKKSARDLSSGSSNSSSSSTSSTSSHRAKGHARAVEDMRATKKKMFKRPLHYVKKYVRGIQHDLGAEDKPFRVVDYTKKINFGKQRNLQRCHYLFGVVLEHLLKEDYICQSGIAGDSLPTSSSSGFDRFGLADSLVVDTRCRSFREETLGRGRNQPSACDSICAEHARFGSQHRKLETKRAGQRRRRSRQTDQAWKGRSQRQQAERQQGPNRPVKHQPNCMAAGGQSAKSGLNEPVLDSIRSSWGSFGRFLKLVDKSPGYSDNFEGVGHRTPFHDGKDFALFPSLFVKPSGAHRSKGARSRLRGRGHDISWEWVKVVWAFFTFLEGGQPYKDVDQRALVRKANLVPWTQKHQEYAGYLHDQIHRFVRLKSESEPLSRGILKLDKLIKVVKISQYDGSKFPTDLSNVAKFVEPSRMSLPSEAGIIDPCRFLKDEKLESFKNMPNIIPLDISPDVPTQGCFKVQDKDIHGVYRRLLASGVAALLPERLAVRDPDGNCITGGLFAVDHKPDSDRIILDRRPFNEIERRLVWARLPHGCLLTQLIVPRGWSVRGSGDDLSNYFYLLKHQEAWLPRNAVGKVFDGAGFEEYGGTPGEKYVLTFRVIAMGDLNAVDIAQQVHLEILKDCHCMKEGEVLAFKSPLPASHCFEGLYIDDHVVVQVLPNRKNRTRRQKFRDEDIMDASRTKYGQEGIPISAKKAYTKSKKFVAWGTEVDSESGRVGSPILKLRQLCDIIIAYCRLKSASKKLTQQILGLLIHPLMHRRCMMCLLQECFCWVETLPDKGNTKIPVKVREELLWVGMCLPLCHTDITWPVSCRIGCSDASLCGGGRAATVTTEPVSSTLFRFAEHRGEHVRLDWASGALAPATEMQQVPVEIEELIQDHSWTVTESISFRHKQHINILETKMIHHELVDAVHSCQDGLRCLLLVDSRAAAGAWAKGRSSSKQLNRLLRRSLGWRSQVVTLSLGKI